VAVLAAAARMSIDTVERETAIIASVGGLAVGFVSAGGILAMERRTTGEILAGITAGAVFGALAGLFVVSPSSFPALAVGGVVLVLFAAVVRRLSERAAHHEQTGQDSRDSESR
jgi:hypothetical protein